MTFWSALILGLVASAHCIGMCGGLQIALQASPSRQDLVIRSQSQTLRYLLFLNVGRVSTYAIAGFVFSLIGASILVKIDIIELFYTARLFTGLVVVLIGMQMLLRNQRPFQFIEVVGAKAWLKVSKLIKHSNNTTSTALINGLAWGFLPCGLVYGVLLSTVFIQQPFHAALVMTGFGIGTLPALVLTGTAYQQFKSFIHASAVQQVAAVFFIAGGTVMITAPYWINKEFFNDYPILLNSVFCLS